MKPLILDPTSWRKEKRYVDCMKRLAKLIKKDKLARAEKTKLRKMNEFTAAYLHEED